MVWSTHGNEIVKFIKKLEKSVDVFVRECYIEEEVFIVVLLVERPHGGRGGRNDVVDKEEQRVFGPQVDALPDQEVELPDGQIRWH